MIFCFPSAAAFVWKIYFVLKGMLWVQWCKLTMTTLLSAGHGWAPGSSWSSWAEGWHSKIDVYFLPFMSLTIRYISTLILVALTSSRDCNTDSFLLGWERSTRRARTERTLRTTCKFNEGTIKKHSLSKSEDTLAAPLFYHIFICLMEIESKNFHNYHNWTIKLSDWHYAASNCQYLLVKCNTCSVMT